MVEAALWARDSKNPAPHLAMVTADEQTAGRGRQGKTWQTFPGHSFAGTYILTENTGSHLPLLAAIALSRALNQLAPTIQPHLQLKWPNDILLNNRKLAGILVERLTPTPPATRDLRPDTYLLGLGLNLTPSPNAPADFPGTALSQSLPKGTSITREDLIKTLTPCISQVLQLYGKSGWPALAGEYVRQCCTIGQTVTWQKTPGVTLTGLARGLDETGALELVDEAGGLHRIHSGEVIAQGRTHQP